jgi:hypothetical protein
MRQTRLVIGPCLKGSGWGYHGIQEKVNEHQYSRVIKPHQFPSIYRVSLRYQKSLSMGLDVNEPLVNRRRMLGIDDQPILIRLHDCMCA